ncbi:helix-turn-helix domain-containing protein [Clostridium sp. MCC353]|uniref:helix-turn-helix domain-containing protein n=1 Tax=Clostridium sp. MCC353 TaxID=2592646 RepID=UPI001C039F2D|nr:AraC family transcriptional regulator [Clostridium sp. MCC353]MBT9776649.1 helix-turn-helix domain-containing protein [Clostridium sp. MCC353]
MAISPCTSATGADGKELISHGTALFPIAVYDDDLLLESVPWHWHEEFEAAIVMEGAAVVAAGSQKHTVKAGNGFFINANVLHSAWNDGSSVCRLHSIVFHPRLPGGNPDSIIWQKYVQPLASDSALSFFVFGDDTDEQKTFLNTIGQVWDLCVNEPDGYELEVRSQLSKFLYRLGSRRPSRLIQPSEKELRESVRIKNMLEFIHLHYQEELNTNLIARSVSVSPSECLRCFHNTIGTTPIQYLKQYRIQKAVELLTGANKKIQDICLECGFQETSYFAKSFREIMGCTPSEYRKRQAKNQPELN